MFFGGGISGFFQDLYYGAVEKGYKIMHPEIWDIDTSVGSSSKIQEQSTENRTGTVEVSTGDQESVELIEKSIDNVCWEKE